MAERNLEIKKNMLKCCICKEEKKLSRVLPCQHSFCFECLELRLQSHSDCKSFSCPVCRVVCALTEINKIPYNLFVDKLIESKNSEISGSPSAGEEGGVDTSHTLQSDESVTSCTICKGCTNKDCKLPHRPGKYPKKHKLSHCGYTPTHDTQQSPACHVHENMYLDFYCYSCKIPMCETCSQHDHKYHTFDEIVSQMDKFETMLVEVLSQTTENLQAVKKVIISTKQEVTKSQDDIKELKENISQKHRAIHEYMTVLEKHQLAEIDKAYEESQRVMSERSAEQERLEVMLRGISVYGDEMRIQGTPYDFATNTMYLKNRLETEYYDPSEVIWKLDVQLEEWNFDMDNVKMSTQKVHKSYPVPESELTSDFSTQYQGDDITCMVCHHDHLIIGHCGHDTIYLYDKKNDIKNSVRITGLLHPQGLCIVQGDKVDYLVVGDLTGKCLWWLTIEREGEEIKLLEPQRHDIDYSPWGISTDPSGQALVSDYDNGRLFMYLHPGAQGTYIKLPHGMQPRVAVRDHEKGFVISDRYQMVWLTQNGKETMRYDAEKPMVIADDIVPWGTDWLVTDYSEHTVHVLTREGKHVANLLSREEGVKQPRCICVDKTRHTLWLAHIGCNGERQVMKGKCSPLNVTKFNLSVTLPYVS